MSADDATSKDGFVFRPRDPEHVGKIVRDPDVLNNQWVLAGTRIPVRVIWNFHKAGYDTSSIIEQYPHLKVLDIEAAIAFESARNRLAAS